MKRKSNTTNKKQMDNLALVAAVLTPHVHLNICIMHDQSLQFKKYRDSLYLNWEFPASVQSQS